MLFMKQMVRCFEHEKMTEGRAHYWRLIITYSGTRTISTMMSIHTRTLMIAVIFHKTECDSLTRKLLLVVEQCLLDACHIVNIAANLLLD